MFDHTTVAFAVTPIQLTSSLFRSHCLTLTYLVFLCEGSHIPVECEQRL